MLRSVAMTLALGAATLLYNGFRPTRAFAASSVAYTVFRTEEGFDQVGTLRYTNHYVEAVRSDGSKMWRGTTNGVQKRTISFENGDYLETNEILGRKSTYPSMYAGPPIPRDPQSSCMTAAEKNSGYTLGGEDKIGGYRSVRVVSVMGARTLTMWYGLGEGCALLQLRLQHETGVTQQKVAAVIPGEPDAALFQLATSLKEVPPSELFDCSDAQGRCAPLADAAKQRLDQKYNSLRSKAAMMPARGETRPSL